jgi:EAL and modified HD-GYP domain-containing signal transduction protein
LGELLWVAKEMNHSNDIDETIARLGANPCFKKELLYEACYEANLFVEETNQTLKEKS